MAVIGENPFKVKALEKAARSVRGYTNGNLAELARTGSLPELDGLGKSTAAAVVEIANTGTFEKLEALKAKVPPGVVELAEVPGIGPGKVQTLWKTAGLESPEAVMAAAERDELVKLKGFGEKTQAAVYNALQYRAAQQGKLHLSTALGLAEEWLPKLRALPDIYRAEVTGELRRSLPVVQTLAFLLAVDTKESLFEALEPLAAPISLEGDHVELELEDGHSARLYAATPDEFECVWFATSTEGEHRKAVQSHFGSSCSEAQAYRNAGLPFIPPPLREGNPARFRTSGLPELLQPSDVRGVLHAHSTYSDGVHSLEEMALAAQAAGYTYLGISDHSQSAFYADGLSPEQVQQQWTEIEQLNAKYPVFRIFKGIESDILHNGMLDYPEEVLKGFDFIIASVHSGLQMDEATATARLIKAIENPYTRILGHPTGRLLLNRPGYPINHAKVLDAAAANGVAVELNCNPWRLDIDWTWLEYALEKGIRIAICPDAHSIEGIQDIRYGVLVAQKGALTPEMTLNALTADNFAAWCAQR